MNESYRILGDVAGFRKKLEGNGFVIGYAGRLYPKRIPENYPQEDMPFGYTTIDSLHLNLVDDKYKEALRPLQGKAVLLLAASNIEYYLESFKKPSKPRLFQSI
jgi:hypothetical protein